MEDVADEEKDDIMDFEEDESRSLFDDYRENPLVHAIDKAAVEEEDPYEEDLYS
jgi:hypothetical protein